MKEFITKNIKVIILILLIVVISLIGVTFAVGMTPGINVTINAGDYAVVYSGSTTLPSANLQPIYDADLLSSTNSSKIMKVTFTVKGASTNPTDRDIIYDVSLSDLNIPATAKHKYLKWRLYKNNVIVGEGNFSKSYDPLVNNRMVLTNIQQDLPSYSSTADSYTFYVWISEACTGDITTCTEDMDVSGLVNQTISGNIRIELSTQTKRGKAYTTLVNAGLDDDIQTTTPSFSKTSCSSGCGEATVGIFQSEDDLGTSYYFRGDVTNNYVYFAGFYWRIIRINGDGTIRMIYDGTSAHANGTSNTNRRIGTTAYNTDTTIDNTNVGYMVGTTGASTYADTHSNTTDSTIKAAVDSWYKTNIVDKGFSSHVVDAIYCNDRSLYSGTGIAAVATTYSGKDRIVTKFEPSLKCSQKNDRFTKSSVIGGVEGNAKLTYPVGLITADEIAMAGGLSGTGNTSMYLYTGFIQWSMTAYTKNTSGTLMMYLNHNGILTNNYTTYATGGIRPVITLMPGALLSGEGTSTSPYRVYQMGDVNRDGFITRDDAQFIMDYYSEIVTPDEEQKVIGDVDGDGDLMPNDAYLILQYIAGNIPEL